MYPTRRFYIALTLTIFLTGSGFAIPTLFGIGKAALSLLLLLLLADIILLYHQKGIKAFRECSARFSNGDENTIRIFIENNYRYPVSLDVIDEIPFIFQARDINFKTTIHARSNQTIRYSLHPTQRGSYSFGYIRIFVSSRLGLVSRRYTCGAPQEIKVYPSYLMLHQYEIAAISNNLTELGIKRIRRIGHHTEFEHIKEYVKGDDYRTINWKASARHHQLMVNIYQDERSQQIYQVIDKGRVMQQAFNGMTLLDYSINAALVLSYIAIRKEDKAGLITFDNKFCTFVPASRQAGHMETLMENLYNLRTEFGETDFSALCIHLNKHINKRSLLVLYTNFANMRSMERQLPYLSQLNRSHRLLVVFFEDEEIKKYLSSQAKDTEEYYRHVIAEKFAFEKRMVISALRKQGIEALLSTPNDLSVDVINKYLEIKTRQLI